jgi:hypothetical protein
MRAQDARFSGLLAVPSNVSVLVPDESELPESGIFITDYNKLHRSDSAIKVSRRRGLHGRTLREAPAAIARMVQRFSDAP